MERQAVVDAAPFRAVRYVPEVAGPPEATSAPAYDRMRRLTYASHRAASPYTILELLTPREGGYGHAADTLRRWRRTGVMTVDREPAFFRYDEIEPGGADQRGIVAAVRLENVGPASAILPHEQVDEAKVRSRLDRLRAAPLDVSPIVGLVDVSPFRTILEVDPQTAADVAFTDDDGVTHRVWRLTADEDIRAVVAALSRARVVIADGHHRYAAALANRGVGAPPAARTLMYLVDAGRYAPRLLPVHRVLTRLPADAPSHLEEWFDVADAPASVLALADVVASQRATAFGLRTRDRSLLLRVRDGAGLHQRVPEQWRQVDTAILERAVLPALGVPAGDVEPFGDAQAAAALVDGGDADAVALLRPVSIATVRSLALAGHLLPPKTTWFLPKPRAGLLMRALDTEEPAGAG